MAAMNATKGRTTAIRLTVRSALVITSTVPTIPTLNWRGDARTDRCFLELRHNSCRDRAGWLGLARAPGCARSQGGAHRPQVGEHRAEERRAQVLGARRATRPRLVADRPLDHLHVAVAPLLHALVEVDEALGDLRRLAVAPVGVEHGALDAIVGL